ncbi:MAG: MliC family protein [Hyphomonadaceae bacterium]|nr:MliC family protein [Hyphomonadaceae bacterium]
MTRADGAIGFALALAACSPAPPRAAPVAKAAIPAATPPPAPVSVWACADGQVLKVAFRDEPERAELVFPDGTMVALPLAIAASGALYEDAATSFHTKGAAALLTAGETSTTCRQESAE